MTFSMRMWKDLGTQARECLHSNQNGKKPAPEDLEDDADPVKSDAEPEAEVEYEVGPRI